MGTFEADEAQGIVEESTEDARLAWQSPELIEVEWSETATGNFGGFDGVGYSGSAGT